MGLRTIIYLNNKHGSYMESNELLASLAKMEASLNEVESARKQVESTVKASSELQKEVREYVSAVKALCVSLQSWASDLRAREGSLSREIEEAITRVDSACTVVIRSFETEVEKTCTDFKTQTEPVIERFAEQVDKLAEKVNDLETLREQIKKTTAEIESVKRSLNEILKELKESQDEQDESLSDIQQKVTNLPSQVHDETLSVIQNIKSTEATLKESVNLVISKADEIIETTKSISSNLDGINTLCQNINSSIISSTTNLTNVIIGAKNDVRNKISEETEEIDSHLADVKSLCASIGSSIESFSSQVISAIDSLKSSEQLHFDSIIRHLEEQENRLNTGIDAVRKQNKLFSIVIIALIVIIIGIIAFSK